MRILLCKVRANTPFMWLNPIVVEPLELAYVKAALNDHTVTLLDPQFDQGLKQHLISHTYDWIILNGYNTAEDMILAHAEWIKKSTPLTKVMVSGVHVQGNPQVFRTQHIDALVKTYDLAPLIDFFNTPIKGQAFKGIDYQFNHCWRVGSDHYQTQLMPLMPDRSFYKSKKNHLYYLDKKGVALFKSSVGCGHACDFCYCKDLNKAHYLAPNFDDLFKAMASLQAPHAWVVDDCLLNNRRQALDFIHASQAHAYSGDIIAYLRADFVVNHADLLADLKLAGLSEVIIGFEAMNQATLVAYNKGSQVHHNYQAVDLLNKAGIDLCALFMVDPTYTKRDFKALYHRIKALNLPLFTLSIWTPIKGTNDYEKLAHQLDSQPSKNFDFLHLLVKPHHMSRLAFYWQCLKINLLLLNKPRIKRFIAMRLRNQS